jgi:hypothetical protein
VIGMLIVVVLQRIEAWLLPWQSRERR